MLSVLVIVISVILFKVIYLITINNSFPYKAETLTNKVVVFVKGQDEACLRVPGNRYLDKLNDLLFI